MKQKLQVFVRGYEHLTPVEKHRARRADEIYESAFREVGLKMDAFERPPAWIQFVEGELDEPALWEKVLIERERRSGLRDKVA